MKVKNINSSSIKTEEIIKTTFVQLLSQKQKIDSISVTELVEKAGITRSSFYTHFDNLYEVAKKIQDDTIALLFNDDIEFQSIEDVNNYIDSIVKYLKENESTYQMILSSYDTIFFFDKVRKSFVDKMYKLFIKYGIKTETLELDTEFFIDGMLFQLIKYFRNPNYYSLDVIGDNVKIWFKKLFF